MTKSGLRSFIHLIVHVTIKAKLERASLGLSLMFVLLTFEVLLTTENNHETNSLTVCNLKCACEYGFFKLPHINCMHLFMNLF